MYIKIIGWIMIFIAVISFSYRICQYFGILWVFYLEIIGIIVYYIGDFINEKC